MAAMSCAESNDPQALAPRGRSAPELSELKVTSAVSSAMTHPPFHRKPYTMVGADLQPVAVKSAASQH